jgi:hypothetical protein
MKPLTLKQFIHLDESSPLLSPVARMFVEAKAPQKSIRGQAGGVLQNKVAKALLSFLPAHLQGKVEIASNFQKGGGTKGIGSVQPDITIYKLDKNGNRIGEPVVIEVKKEEAQGVSVTLNREGGKWIPTEASAEKWKSFSDINRKAIVKKIGPGSDIEKRLNSILPQIGAWMGNAETAAGKIAFYVTKEIWEPLLNTYTTGEKWRIELDKHWSALQGLAAKGGDHFIYIENIGLLSTGAATPSWFATKGVPKVASLDAVDVTSREMEVRLKKAGSAGEVSLKRTILIHNPIGKEIKSGTAVYMDDYPTITKLAYTKAVKLNNTKKTLVVNGKPMIYSTSKGPTSILVGTIENVSKMTKMKGLEKTNVVEVTCSMKCPKARVTFLVAPRVEGRSKTTLNKGLDVLSKAGADLFWGCVK